jgi:exopolysaccharide biosynthesis polyprenyl glycosylphosphotransferase
MTAVESEDPRLRVVGFGTGGAIALPLATPQLHSLRTERWDQLDPAFTPDTDSAFVRGVDSAQRSLRQPLPIVLDVSVGGAAVLASTGSVKAALVGAAGLLAGGLLVGLWKYRSSLEAQGVSFYLKPAGVAAGVSGAITAAAGLGIDRAATVGLSLIGILTVLHLALWLLLARARRRGAGLRPALVVGPADPVDVVRHRISMYPESGLRVVAVHHPRSDDGLSAHHDQALVDELITLHGVEHVVCVASHTDAAVFKDFVRFAAGRVDFSLVFPLSRLARSFSHVGDLNVAAVPMRTSWGTQAAKRIFDTTIAALLLIALSPLLALIAIAVRLGDPGPAIYKQHRPGRNGRTFTIYKFRSMRHAPAQIGFLNRDDVDKLCFKIDNDPRITPVGKWIRRYSLDELPQLWNVLRGDMSLVGPRPLAFSLDQFDQRAAIRHRVRPGITGLWQVSGANALTDGDMFDLDMSYVVNRSFGLDLLLIAKTIPTLMVRRAPY